MRRLLIPFAAVLLVATSAVSLAQCNKTPATPPASDYELIGTVHDIMEGIVDPASDVLFDAVATDTPASVATSRKVTVPLATSVRVRRPRALCGDGDGIEALDNGFSSVLRS